MKIINNIKKAIAQKVADLKARKEAEEAKKFLEVRYEWIKFYEQREEHLGNLQLPAFVQADQQMKIIVADGQLNHYYKKVMRYRKEMQLA